MVPIKYGNKTEGRKCRLSDRTSAFRVPLITFKNKNNGLQKESAQWSPQLRQKKRP